MAVEVRPNFLTLFNVFFYAPALFYIATKQSDKGVKFLTNVFAIVTLLYNADKLSYNKGRTI